MPGWLLVVLIAVVLAAAAWLVLLFNGLIAMRQHCITALADIDVQLKMRHDLVPGLLEAAKVLRRA